MKTSKIKLIALLCTGIIAVTALVCCSNDKATEPEAPTETQQVQAPSGNTQTATRPEADNGKDTAAIYQMQIEYYEKLIADLEDRLLNEKEENFIEISEYKQMIKDLEGNIAALSDKIANIQVNQSPAPENNAVQNNPSNSGTTTKPDVNTDDKTNVDKPSSIPNQGQIEQKPENTVPSNPPTEITTTNPFAYEIKNGSITITAYNGKESDVTIPGNIAGLTVTAIGEGAFRESNVEKVTLPESITHIDWFAFSGCKKLCEVSIPSSVTSVGYGAFENCSGFLVIKCEKGSYIEAFAASWGILAVAK